MKNLIALLALTVSAAAVAQAPVVKPAAKKDCCATKVVKVVKASAKKKDCCTAKLAQSAKKKDCAGCKKAKPVVAKKVA